MGKRRVFLFQGPPTSGKGTIVGNIRDLGRAYIIESGEMIRQRKRTDPEFARRCAQSDKGKFVDDDTVLSLVEERLRNVSDSLLILDGVPRTVSQAEWVVPRLLSLGFEPVTIELNHIDREWGLRRAEIRREEYKAAGMEPRKDDDPQVVNERFDEHERHYPPLRQFMLARTRFFELDAREPKDDVFAAAKRIIFGE